MGVAGGELLAGGTAADTQDFVLADSPRFPVATCASTPSSSSALARRRALRLLPRRLAPAVALAGARAPAWRSAPRRAPPASLLQTQYYSGTAYRLGPEQYVEVRSATVRARGGRRAVTGPTTCCARRLKEELARGDACLELPCSYRCPGRNMPVEDPTVLWSERESPFLPVARITIPKQVFDTPEQDVFCEELSFTPWHALPEHEPVGGLNRLRRAVHLEISRYRHARNDRPRGEPRG